MVFATQAPTARMMYVIQQLAFMNILASPNMTANTKSAFADICDAEENPAYHNYDYRICVSKPIWRLLEIFTIRTSQYQQRSVCTPEHHEVPIAPCIGPSRTTLLAGLKNMSVHLCAVSSGVECTYSEQVESDICHLRQKSVMIDAIWMIEVLVETRRAEHLTETYCHVKMLR